MSALQIAVVTTLAIPYLMVVRALAGHFAWWQVERWYEDQARPDGLDWFLGTAAAFAWPAFLPVLLILFSLTRLVRSIHPPRIGAEKRALQRERAERFQKTLEDMGMDEGMVP